MNAAPPRRAETGSVTSQASRTSRIVFHCSWRPRARPAPAIEPVETCVVDTGSAYWDAAATSADVTRFATKCNTPGCDAGVCNQDHIPCPTGICRTPGFWATHAGSEKGPRSQNITLAVIQATPTKSITICGECINDTALNDAASAVEAMCVSPRGDPTLQLARQLTAAALNCVISGGAAD